jgi:hypothetical protein
VMSVKNTSGGTSRIKVPLANACFAADRAADALV